MGLQGLERRLERMVEGVFARAFRSSLRPIELGRRLIREIDDHRTVDVKGKVVVPNAFAFTLSANDAEQFAEIRDALVRELADAAREYARDEGYGFKGPITITIEADPNLKVGRFNLTSRMQEGPPGTSTSAIILGSGERMALGNHTLSIGRLPECDVTFADSNVSRRHAELRAVGGGYVIVDLGSTNGTRVNGVAVREQLLRNGDEVSVGSSRFRYEAS
jgi:FHA domain-containing protein